MPRLGDAPGVVLEDLRFKGDSFRQMYLREHFGRTDKIALITCLKNLNVSGSFLRIYPSWRDHL